MSRDNGKKYPKTIESKNSYLRIRAPEHLDVALEGLIRKVLKEQPKMDDIYQFAADYFDMLLKLREKSGIRKLSVQDICPQHNEEDANEMIKLASTFTKRKKESKSTSRSYRTVSIKQCDHRHERKGSKLKDGEVTTPKNGERFNTVLPIVNEHPELEDAKPVETIVKREKSESDAEESEMDFMVDVKSQDTSEKFVEAREVILEEEGEEEGDVEESGVDIVGDISEIRDKIKVVENEIKSLEKRESEVGKEGNPNDETVEEVKAEVEDVNSSEATPVVEEPLQESEDTKPTAENEVTIQEVTDEDSKKEGEEENVNAGETEGRGTESMSESITEEGQEAENTGEEVKEEQRELETITEGTEGKKDDETPSEEAHISEPDSIVNREEEVSKAEEATQEGIPNEGVVVEETTEPGPDTTIEQMQEGLEENSEDKVSEQETPQETQDTEVQRVEETEEPAKLDEATEDSAQAELDVGEEGEVLETKTEAKSIEEGAMDSNIKEEDNVEETKAWENEDTKEVNQNEDSTVAAKQSLDPAQAKEIELMGGDAPKDEKIETEDFVNSEKQSEEVQNAEPSSSGPIEVSQTEELPPLPELVNSENMEEDDTVVITVPENTVEEKPIEEESLPPTGEGNDTENVKSIAQEVIGVAGGLGAAAVVLEHAKRELTDPKPEETPEKEEKVQEAGPEPSAEEDLLRGEPEKEEMTLTEEVQKFLDRERQHSSYDKETEGLVPVEQRVNQTTETPDTEVVSEIIPGAVTRMALPENEVKDEETTEKAQLGPSDVEAEGEDQEREGSTTSDEIEFEISPLKFPEEDKTMAEAGTNAENDTANVPAVEVDTEDQTAEDKTDAAPELELNGSEAEDQPIATNIEDAQTEPVKVFLSVPETVEEEYPRRNPKDAIQQQEGSTRSKRSVDPSEDSVNAEEIIIDCANVGNEIIQTGEVQKVELIEGDEDILQVHLTTTIETVQEDGDSLLVQMTSKIDPTFEVSMETKVESPAFDEKMRLVRAAVVIQNGFRRFRKRKIAGEPSDASTEELDASIVSETKLDLSVQSHLRDASSRESESSFSSSATKINNRDFKGRNLSRSVTRTLLETHSLDPIRKITPLKTRSLSSVRYGVADFEVWNQLVKELEEAATKIQSNYRGYKTRKKLQRGNAIQSTTTTSEESSATTDTAEVNHRHTGEFHDSIVLPPPSK